MGFNRRRAHALGVMMVFLLLMSVGAVFPTQSMAYPNPIPILTMTLEPSSQTATVDHLKGDTLTFDGKCTVEQLDIYTSTVTLTGAIDDGWGISVDPETITFSSSGSVPFLVTVTVPPGVEDGKQGNVGVQGSCKAPLIQPSLAAATSLVKVVNTSPVPEWDVRITEPTDGGVFTTDSLTISGTASFNLGEITSVEVKVCTGQWQVATGTSQWSIDYDCSFLDDGDHSINVRARSGEDQVSPVVMINAVQDRADTDPVPGGGGGVPGDPGGDSGSMTTYLLIGVVLLVTVVAVYWVHRRRSRDTVDYITHYY